MNNNSSGGIGICGVLGIVFIVLKLVGVINWSWVWVLCPFWLPVVGLILFIIFMFVREKLDDIFNP